MQIKQAVFFFFFWIKETQKESHNVLSNNFPCQIHAAIIILHEESSIIKNKNINMNVYLYYWDNKLKNNELSS